MKLSNSLNDGNTVNQRQCQVIIKDPEKTQDPAGIRTQDLLITSQTLLHANQPEIGLLCAHFYIVHVYMYVVLS